MTEADFDPTERIAGFSLVNLKKALSWVGIMDDRDDIDNVAQALKCPRGQAERVLEELERRGLVTKTPNRKQWKTTPKGHTLGFHWRPPRRFTPAIDRESMPRGINEVFAEVPCAILRTAADKEDMFEEAGVQVAVQTEYETDRLVEISVMQPDDYDDPHGGGLYALSLYLSAADARAFAEGLQKAVEKAERDGARLAKVKARREARALEKRLEAAKHAKQNRGTRAEADSALGTPHVDARPTKAARSSTQAGRPAPKERESDRQGVEQPSAEPSDEGRAEAIATALKKLRETNRARLTAKSGRPQAQKGTR